MPFTFSHPAAVLPLHKATQRLSFAALVIGSITPDFEYFIRLKSRYSHSFAGAFYFDLPMALLIAFLFFNIAKDPLLDNLPTFLRSRLGAVRAFNWNEHFRAHWLKVLISLLIGIFSHLLWDSFTHQAGWFVQRFPAMEADLGPLPIYRILQHCSTIVGGLVVFRFVVTQPHKPLSASKANRVYWFAVLGIAGLTAAAILDDLSRHSLWNIAIVSIASVLLALLIAPFMIRVFYRS
jgi:hypothetical protein